MMRPNLILQVVEDDPEKRRKIMGTVKLDPDGDRMKEKMKIWGRDQNPGGEIMMMNRKLHEEEVKKRKRLKVPSGEQMMTSPNQKESLAVVHQRMIKSLEMMSNSLDNLADVAKTMSLEMIRLNVAVHELKRRRKKRQDHAAAAEVDPSKKKTTPKKLILHDGPEED